MFWSLLVCGGRGAHSSAGISSKCCDGAPSVTQGGCATGAQPESVAANCPAQGNRERTAESWRTIGLLSKPYKSIEYHPYYGPAEYRYSRRCARYGWRGNGARPQRHHSAGPEHNLFDWHDAEPAPDAAHPDSCAESDRGSAGFGLQR